MELNEENLYKEYIEKKQTVKDVSNIFNVSESIIKRRLQKYNIHKDRKEIFRQSKSKLEKTMIEKYGTVSAMKNPEIKEKMRKNSLNKYGVEYPTQSNIVKEKIKKTNREKYGFDYGLQNKEVINKRKKTCIEKYGVDNPAKSKKIQEKMRQTSQKKYGIDNPGGLPEFVQKGKETNIRKYGVNYTGKLREFRIKSVKSSKSIKSKINGKRFDSSYERDVYDYCLKNDIKIEDIQIPIEYEYKNKKHITFIDFKINGKLIECKGYHLLRGIFDSENFVPIISKIELYEKNNIILITDKRGVKYIKTKEYKIKVLDIKDFFKDELFKK